MSDRVRDAAIQLVRALRSDEDVRRIQRVERAIDNQGNPILDNVTIVAGGGGGGTVIVAWGAITGTLTDQTDLKNALDSKVTLNGLEWTVVTESVGNLQDAVSALEQAVEDLETGNGLVVWGSIIGTLADQTDLKNALDAKVTLGGLEWTIVTGSISNLQVDVADLQSDKADTNHTHVSSDITSGTFDAARIPNLPASTITSGTIAPARLGSGTPDNTTFLRGDSSWATPAASVAWGQITGTLSNQTDLQNALDAKQDALTYALWKILVDDHMAATDNPHSVTYSQVGAAAASHQHNAADINAGTLNIDRIPTGTSGTTVALGNHTHEASAITSGTFSEARIPSLPVSRITNLQTALDGKVDDDWHQYIALGSQFTTTSSSLQTVTGLNLAVGSNQRWLLTYVLPIGCSGAGGMDLAVQAPAGSSLTAMAYASDGANGSNLVTSMIASPGQFGLAVARSAYSFGVPAGMATIQAIVATSGTSGNVSLQIRSITGGQTSAVGGGSIAGRLSAIRLA